MFSFITNWLRKRARENTRLRWNVWWDSGKLSTGLYRRCDFNEFYQPYIKEIYNFDKNGNSIMHTDLAKFTPEEINDSITLAKKEIITWYKSNRRIKTVMNLHSRPVNNSTEFED